MRSLKKGPFIDRNLLKSVEKVNVELENLSQMETDTTLSKGLYSTDGQSLTLNDDNKTDYNMRSLKIPAKIWSRRSVILPQFVGFTFQVHNGNRFIPVKVTQEMVGHKFGEFSPTRKPTIHKEAKKKK